MESIWSGNIKLPSFETLNRDIKTDVLIIGGGIAGILCGYMLKNSGVDCVVVEAEKIANLTTQKTTAKITCQHGMIYNDLINKFGTEIAGLYLEAQIDALEQYRKLSESISCDFEKRDSVVYSLDDRQKAEKETLALQKLGCPAHFEDSVNLPLPIAGAVRIGNQAQFHPLKFLSSVADNIRIYENTRILEISPDGAESRNSKIRAEKIIVATHFPFIDRYGGYFLKMYQHRSYVLALKNATCPDGMYVDESDTGMSFRSYGGMLLLGGGGHRTGKKGGGWEELSRFAKKHYPGAQEVCRWATQDCMTLDKIPYIGQYSKSTPYLYVATGFNKWGMTSSMVAATLLRDLICDNKNKYSQVFSPSRSIMHPQLAVNAAHTLINVLSPTVPRCTHLGCALKYNPQEHSWDCPCHGSRFTEEGKLIDSPANKDANPGKKN